MPKPTIAAINGYCLGGGMEMALACDLRFASATAMFGQPEINLGLIPGWGGTQRLARLAGLGIAKELVLSGRTLDAGGARSRARERRSASPRSCGPSSRSAPRCSRRRAAVALARRRRRSTRRSLATTGEPPHEGDQFASLFSTSDAREGMAAFLEKREPRFTGK